MDLIKHLSFYAEKGMQAVPLHLAMQTRDGKQDKIPFFGVDKFGVKLGWKGGVSKEEALDRVPLLGAKFNAIAILTGEASNLFVLDVDNSNGKDGAASLEKFGIVIPPGTPCVQTQSGGRHYYFEYPEGLEGTTSASIFEKGSGLDIRGENGLVFAPPSRVDNGGGEYSWITPLNGELKPAPQGLIRHIIARQATKPATPPPKIAEGARDFTDLTEAQRRVLEIRLSECENAPKGSRSEADFSLVCWCVKVGMSESATKDMCRGLGKFGEKGDKFDGYFATTYKKAVADVGAQPAFHPTHQPARMPEGPADDTTPTSEPVSAASEIEVVSLADFMATRIPEPPQIIKGVLHQGAKMVWGGPSKSFKSWAISDIALSVAAGVPWMEHEVVQGKVLILNLEIMKWAIQRRFESICQAKQVAYPRDVYLANMRGKIRGLPDISEMIHKLPHRDWSMIIPDPIYKLLLGRDENKASDVAELCNEIEELTTSTGAALLFSAHFAKGLASAKEAMDRISGSGVWARDPDVIATCSPLETDREFAVDIRTRMLPDPPKFAIRWEFPLFHMDGSIDATKLRQKAGGRPVLYMLDDLMAKFKPGQTTTELMEATGMPKSRFYVLLKEAIAAKRLIKAGHILNNPPPPVSQNPPLV